ncbi:MAG: hypothetical protein Metus_0268 [Candidatus Methanosuratincola subterraneus]|jgi:hypothetical protein|uniref:Type IV pilin n=2 Tax=Candidatus Methanosuratincola (ex Vanwonterghem et al. 2016) TaxID=1915412 RepID=A0A7J3UZL0_9CREN|nr:MAG: hypothetical protein Metus_0268 [Candidatus Methanosuratincola subterraneus]
MSANRNRGRIRSKRGEISTPIITILVTVAALAVTGIAVSWMLSTGAAAANQGALMIVGSPVVQNDTLYLTVRNIGNANASISSCLLGGQNATRSDVIQAGKSMVLNITFSGANFTTGTILKGSLNTDQGILPFSAFVQ